MSDNYDYLGNEFLLWLWWKWDGEANSMELSDESIVSGMFARTLTLDCPFGESGKETISSEVPCRLARSSFGHSIRQAPTQSGLTLVRHDEQYDFALQAETFNVGGGKITQIGEAGARDTLDRIASVREMTDTFGPAIRSLCRTTAR